MHASAGDQAKDKPKLIVLPLQPQQGQAYDGTGVAVHFLLGNIIVLHTAFEESWFGWRVKKIFPEEGALRAYCRGAGPRLDTMRISKEQGIRYLLRGRVWPWGNKIRVALALTDAQAVNGERTTELVLEPADQLVGFRRGFLTWFETSGLPLPSAQEAKALWPEKTSLTGLDTLGRALEIYYLHAYRAAEARLDLLWFDKAVSAAPDSYLAHDLKGWALYRRKEYQAAQESFHFALEVNPNGLGALAGLMWCGIYTHNEEMAYTWAAAKADLLGKDPNAAKTWVASRMERDVVEKKQKLSQE
jgi:tetratricopeptide (TPR) repeat protein